MPPLVFGLEEFQRLRLSESAAAVWIVLQDEIHEGLPDDHAHLGRLARMGASVPAGALVDGDIGRPFEYQVPGHRVGNDLLQLAQRYISVQGDNGASQLRRQHLAVVAVGQPPLGLRTESGDHMREGEVDEKTNILVEPAMVNVGVRCAEIQNPLPSTFPNQPPGRRSQRSPPLAEEPNNKPYYQDRSDRY